jgi:hypothetical protein
MKPKYDVAQSRGKFEDDFARLKAEVEGVFFSSSLGIKFGTPIA